MELIPPTVVLMGGFIVLDDGRALALNNNWHDVVVELMGWVDLRTVTVEVRDELRPSDPTQRSGPRW